MGLAGANALGLSDKRLLVFMETDGCGADGVSVATGCWVGRRTMRIFDYGKMAATFVDARSGQAVRVAPRPGIREAARRYAPTTPDRWSAQLKGYGMMPESELLRLQPVILTIDLERLLSRPGVRVICEACGEEVMNERQIVHEGMTLCRTCASESYYRLTPASNRFLVSA
jgi:formylmethanofuran dehydrogenase subunit E